MDPEHQQPYWSQPLEALFTRLGSSLEGMTAAGAAARLAQAGPNALTAGKESSWPGLLIDQFKSPIVLILLAATIISAFVQDWTDAIIILAIVIGSALLSFFQEYSASSAAQKLRSQISLKSTVLRDGQRQTVLTAALVPGDVVLLSAGSLVPADGVIVTADDFFVNQAVLTGETFPVEKTSGVTPADGGLPDRTNCVFMGTNVRSGSARVLIVENGLRTNFGQISKRLTLRPPETEFERGIKSLGMLLTEVMFVLVIGIFAVNVLFQKPALDSLLFSIALAVGLTPQLLPAIININLSRGSLAMARSGVIVRRLTAIENFGSMDILCTDKTGTLTVGVVKLDGALDSEGQASPAVMQAAWLNAHFQTGMPNPLDEAILAGTDIQANGIEKVDEIPYDFVRKRLGMVVEEQGACRLIVKGALDNILAVCSQVQTAGGSLPLDAAQNQALRARYAAWSEQGYRVLGVAQRAVAKKSQYPREDEKDLTFLGFLLFFDPPKPGVTQTIQKLKDLGVDLKIITGDNQLVARHTGLAIGLSEPRLMTGKQIEDLHDEALWHSAEKTDIFAEVDPNEKERIILALKKMGHVVGYMGDGINDAPSLHSADVGISVDNAVDVAKEAADFVLLRQDLEVLVQGILQGRRTFANTLKYVFMATSANFGNMFSMAGASLFLPFLPMLPKQILLINFFTDLPEMTIAGDSVDDVFIRRPRRWDVGFIRRFMLVFGPLSSLFDFATFGLLMYGLRAAEPVFHTGWFIESVLSATLVVFAVRTRLPFQKSRPSRAMLLTTLAVIASALLLPYTPLAAPLGFAPLPLSTLGAILVLVAGYFTLAEITKRWFFRRYLPN